MSLSVVLLRGINVGAHHRVSMNDLTAILSAEGLAVRATYLASGNVVVETPATDLDLVALEGALASACGFSIALFSRTDEEWAQVAARVASAGAGDLLHVAFCREVLDVRDDGRFAPETFEVDGREVYLTLPSGMGRSVMAPTLRFLRDATVRNAKTVAAVNALLSRG